MRRRKHQKCFMLSGSSPWPVVAHTHTTTGSWMSWDWDSDLSRMEWSTLSSRRTQFYSTVQSTYHVIAVHGHHASSEVPPLALPAHSRRHILCSASLAAIQYQKLSYCGHTGPILSFSTTVTQSSVPVHSVSLPIPMIPSVRDCLIGKLVYRLLSDGFRLIFPLLLYSLL